MPFGGNFDSYYKEIIIPSIQESNLTPVRADEIYGTKSIIEDIFEEIYKAKLIVADVSHKNPNVNYELGVAHALNKPVIIISSSMNDVPFDYRHRRIIIYDTSKVSWSDRLKDSIKKTIASINFTDEPDLFTKKDKAIGQIVNFLSRMQLIYQYEISKESEIKSDEHGNCFLNQTWQVKAKTDVTHVAHQIYIDSPGDIEIVNIRDILNRIDLDYIIRNKSDISLEYFILFEHLLSSDEVINLSVEIKADNYLSDLVNKSKGYVFHKHMKKGNSTFSQKIEKYIFPDIEKFKKLQAIIKNHPDKSQVGKLIKSTVQDGKRVIYLELCSVQDYQGDFGAELTI